jgi:hypothetical protein
MSEQLYYIQRFCQDDSHPDHRKVIEEGLTLEQAQAHCQRPDTSGRYDDGTSWFDGYQREA